MQIYPYVDIINPRGLFTIKFNRLSDKQNNIKLTNETISKKLIGGRLVHETTTYKCDDTGGCVIHF